MIYMMTPGRVYQGHQAIDLGLAEYRVAGSSLDATVDVARRAAQNLPLSNFAICSAVSHMRNMSALDAAYAEAVLAGVVNTQPEGRARLAAFADKSAARVRPTVEASEFGHHFTRAQSSCQWRTPALPGWPHLLSAIRPHALGCLRRQSMTIGTVLRLEA